jgi:hypothetical protein
VSSFLLLLQPFSVYLLAGFVLVGANISHLNSAVVTPAAKPPTAAPPTPTPKPRQSLLTADGANKCSQNEGRCYCKKEVRC